jgi:hypothetical protein
MRKILAIKMILFAFASVCFSQQVVDKKQSNIIEGEEIIRKACEAVALGKVGVSSVYYKAKTSVLDKMPNGNALPDFFEEISLTLPDKIHAIYSTGEPLRYQSFKTWNGEKYKSIFETEILGRKIVKDDTNAENVKPSKSVVAVLGKENTALFENIKRVDPKESLKESMWTELFPMIFSHPLEPKLEFQYVGKAKSNDKIANVTDVKSANGKTYRLLFDSETNYLLMMIVSFKRTDQFFTGDQEMKYYFSQRETVDGILIPRKVKVENKQTAKGQPSKTSFLNLEILEFKINPEFKKDLFEIK